VLLTRWLRLARIPVYPLDLYGLRRAVLLLEAFDPHELLIFGLLSLVYRCFKPCQRLPSLLCLLGQFAFLLLVHFVLDLNILDEVQVWLRISNSHGGLAMRRVQSLHLLR
jgi:hypothetical protein